MEEINHRYSSSEIQRPKLQGHHHDAAVRLCNLVMMMMMMMMIIVVVIVVSIIKLTDAIQGNGSSNSVY